MSKNRVYELAKEYNIASKVIIDILSRNNIVVKNHMSSVDEAGRLAIERAFARKTGQTDPEETKIGDKAEKKQRQESEEREINPGKLANKGEIHGKSGVSGGQLNQNIVEANRPKDKQQFQVKPQNGQEARTVTDAGQERHRTPYQGGQGQQQRPHQQGGQRSYGQQGASQSGQRSYSQQAQGQSGQRSYGQQAQGQSGQRSYGQQAQGQSGQRSYGQQAQGQSGQRSYGQQAQGQSGQQQFQHQPGQPRPGFQPRDARHDGRQPGAQQRQSGSNERQGQAWAGQNQRQFAAGADNKYIRQEQTQRPPQRGNIPQQGAGGANVARPSQAPDRQFASKKPDYSREQTSYKPTTPAAAPKQAGKGKDRQTQNQRGGLFKDASFDNGHGDKKGRQTSQSRFQRNNSPQTQFKTEMPKPKSIKLGSSIPVKELSSKLAREVSEIIKKLMGLGVLATINQEVDFDTASLIATEFGVNVEQLPPEEDPTEIPEIEDDVEDLVYRFPVVTVMGHVDHGKTSLLDSIRQTNVIAQEAGGITQHIGAYQVMCQGKKIVFLDTPGHEAFTAMRARGAQITDVAILVVAADDGVMPQTLEAINHAKSAEVPIIVAINKMDRPGANPDRVKQQLSDNGLIPEDWGGDTVMVPVSAYQKTGINELLEMILLVAEMLDLKANPNRKAYGTIIEAKLDKGRGPVATVLVQKGTLRIGDSIIVGTTFGKVRAMSNDRGEKLKKAEPSTPVEVLGLADVPLAGDVMVAVDEKTARAVSEKRVVKKRSEDLKHSHKVSLEDLFKQIQDGNIKDLNIVVKADVQGSIEALAQSLANLKNKEVRVNIVHAGVGAINESDVMLASASNALIIGFNVRPDANARRVADNEKIDIRTYRVIYEAINDVEAAITGMLAPEYKEVVYGRLEIRQIISVPKAVVAGSYVLEGKITNNSQIRLIRNGIVIFEGKVESLRRFKDDVKEVAQGYECGVTIEKYRDIKEGDIIETFKMEQVTPKTGQEK